MKSEWKVTSQVLNGKRKYNVYRVKDISQVVHSGNVEYAPGMEYVEDRGIAEKAAYTLNQLEVVE